MRARVVVAGARPCIRVATCAVAPRTTSGRRRSAARTTFSAACSALIDSSGSAAAVANQAHAVLAAAAVAGLTALLTASEVGYTTLRIAGAIYLVYLGSRALAEFVRLRRINAEEAPTDYHAVPSEPVIGRVARVSFRQGLVSNLLNPKVAAFYLSLFPQFVLPGMSTTVAHAVLAGLFWVMCLLWFVLVLSLLARVEVLLRRRDVRRGLAGVSGVSLVGLGAALGLRG